MSVYGRFVIKDTQVASADGLVDVMHASQRVAATVAPVHKWHLSTIFRPANQQYHKLSASELNFSSLVCFL